MGGGGGGGAGAAGGDVGGATLAFATVLALAGALAVAIVRRSARAPVVVLGLLLVVLSGCSHNLRGDPLTPGEHANVYTRVRWNDTVLAADRYNTTIVVELQSTSTSEVSFTGSNATMRTVTIALTEDDTHVQEELAEFIAGTSGDPNDAHDDVLFSGDLHVRLEDASSGSGTGASASGASNSGVPAGSTSNTTFSPTGGSTTTI